MLTTQIAAVLLPLAVTAQPAGAEVNVLLAFASYRVQPMHPTVYFYEHDGNATGKLVGSITTAKKRSDYHPSLQADGAVCAFAAEVENQVGKILIWNRAERRLVDIPDLAKSAAWNGATLSGDGQWLGAAGWSASRRWDVALYDLKAKKFRVLPGLNSEVFHERKPALSSNGRFLAFASNRQGVGGTDIFLYDCMESKLLPPLKCNALGRDSDPSLSADGRLIAFTSDRPGGKGGRDIYLYDLRQNQFLVLPGLNSIAHEQSPSLSPDGRFIAFVSDRFGGKGERDIFLYDRKVKKLLPTPGLNAKSDDIDPCVIVIEKK